MGVLEMEAKRVKETLRGVLDPCGFECYPFKIGWYNDCVRKPFEFQYDRDTLAFILISTPSMFEKAFLPFLGSDHCAGTWDPIDQCMDYHFKRAIQAFPDEDIELIHDYDMNHMRRPRVLVQTAGHVSGAAFYYQRSSVKHDPWGKRKSIHGVSIHPKFGGWFGLRGILIFKNICVPTMPHVPPQDVLSDELKIEVLNRFNGNWRDGTFRDIIPVEDSYSQAQRTYFTTWPKDRKPLIEQLKEQVLKENGGQGELNIGATTIGMYELSVCDSDSTQKAVDENQKRNRIEEQETQIGNKKQNDEVNMGNMSELKTSILHRCPYHFDGKQPQTTNVWTTNALSTDTI